MVSFRDALTNGIRNAYCQMLGNAENFWNQYFPTIGSVPNPGLGAARFAQRLLCDREPPPIPTSPFTGGQCCGVSYTVSVSATVVDQNGLSSTGTTGGIITGKVDRIVLEFPTANSYNVAVYNSPPPGCDVQFRSVLAGGTSAVPYDQAASFLTNVTVTPPPGTPDDCGNPQPVPLPDNDYNVFNIPITYNDIDNNPITIPITLVFAPVAIGNNNLIQIPFNVNVPIDFGLNLNGTINLPDGDINFNFGGGNGVSGSDDCPPPQSDLPDDTPPIPPDVPDNIPPIDPDEIPQVIRGAIVTTSFVPENTSVYFQDDIPDLYLPRLGNVQFLIEIDGKLAWSEAIDVNNKRQLVLCPWEGGAIRVDGFPRPGIIWDVTPVYDLSSLPIPVRPYVQP